MAYYSNSQVQAQDSPKVPTFVTKVPHDVVLTDTDSRIFIKNIKTGITASQLKASLEKYGPVQVHMYEQGNRDNGWAWVGFENKESALAAVKDAEKEAAERKNNAKTNGNLSNTERNETDEKDEDSHSFDVENEDSQLNENEDIQEGNEYKDDQDE